MNLGQPPSEQAQALKIERVKRQKTSLLAGILLLIQLSCCQGDPGTLRGYTSSISVSLIFSHEHARIWRSFAVSLGQCRLV